MTNTDTMKNNFQQIKTEGGDRSRKIGKIFQAAFAEAAEEMKAGATTLRPVAQELADTAAHTARVKGQEMQVNVRKAFAETAADEQDVAVRLKLKLRAILQAIRATLLSSWKTADTALPAQPDAADRAAVNTAAL